MGAEGLILKSGRERNKVELTLLLSNPAAQHQKSDSDRHDTEDM